MKPDDMNLRLAIAQIAAILDRIRQGGVVTAKSVNDIMELIDDSKPEIAAGYGWCPVCGYPGLFRERRINGDDRCVNDHVYFSSSAIMDAAKADERRKRHGTSKGE